MKTLTKKYFKFTNFLEQYGGDIPLLALRLILAYAFFGPALMKWGDMSSTIEWFGNEEYGLGMPAPTLMAYLAATTEIVGVYLLLFGLGTRWISLPLVFTMIIAILTVHIDHGWLAIADSANNPEVAERLSAAKSILRNNGNYEWLTGKGSFVILNNGIEFPVIYITMLLVLLVKGSGRISLDFLIGKFIKRKIKS